MEKAKDFKIVFSFRSNSYIPAQTVAKLITLVENCVTNSEIENWHSYKKEFPELTEEMIQKFTKGASDSNFKGFYLEKASSGSIELFAIVAAASTWLLLNTIGKSVTEAYKKTELHNKVVDFALLKFGNRIEKLIIDIKRTIKMNLGMKYENIDVEYDESEDDNAITFYIIVIFKSEYFPTQGKLQLIDKTK